MKKTQFLSNLTYEEVEKKLEGFESLSPCLLDKKDIVASNTAVQWYEEGKISGEKHGNRMYILHKQPFLNYVRELFHKNEVENLMKNEKKVRKGNIKMIDPSSIPSPISQTSCIMISKAQMEEASRKLDELRGIFYNIQQVEKV